MKIRRFTDGHGFVGFHYWCPGCKGPHGIYIEQKNCRGAQWSWDGNEESPTFAPSILSTYDGKDAGTEDAPPARCHSFVMAGRIEFLGDCTHDLAGKTVDIPEWPWE